MVRKLHALMTDYVDATKTQKHPTLLLENHTP